MRAFYELSAPTAVSGPVSRPPHLYSLPYSTFFELYDCDYFGFCYPRYRRPRRNSHTPALDAWRREGQSRSV